MLIDADALGSGDAVVEDLDGAAVFVRGRLAALRLRRLRRCSVYAGPVCGATFVDDVQARCSVGAGDARALPVLLFGSLAMPRMQWADAQALPV
jgi:hypothetical protein